MQTPAAPPAPQLFDIRKGTSDLTDQATDFRRSRRERLDETVLVVIPLSYAVCVAVVLVVAWKMSGRPSGEQWTYLLLALALGWAGTILALLVQRRTRARRR